MGLGSTAKKIQLVSDRAEQMYKQVQELQGRIVNLEEEVDDTHDTVKKMDHQLTEQRALLLALAEERGLDGEEILAEVAIDDLDDADDAAETAEETTDESSAPSGE
ncbi:DUF5798 family protein [Natrononativus amylolyticus]|uniref:DUF5798 family protein n=1 Tax=Natrononativus amylolyticus TaxID=2963434 RepID=UPI0020CC0EF6|nr:DUF5798 family protein [Natrononativus amylolyticus]